MYFEFCVFYQIQGLVREKRKHPNISELFALVEKVYVLNHTNQKIFVLKIWQFWPKNKIVFFKLMCIVGVKDNQHNM